MASSKSSPTEPGGRPDLGKPLKTIQHDIPGGYTVVAQVYACSCLVCEVFTLEQTSYKEEWSRCRRHGGKEDLGQPLKGQLDMFAILLPADKRGRRGKKAK